MSKFTDYGRNQGLETIPLLWYTSYRSYFIRNQVIFYLFIYLLTKIVPNKSERLELRGYTVPLITRQSGRSVYKQIQVLEYKEISMDKYCKLSHMKKN